MKKFYQDKINHHEAQMKKYTDQALRAEGEEFNELLLRVENHQREINNYQSALNRLGDG